MRGNGNRGAASASSRVQMIGALRRRLGVSAAELPDNATNAQINALLERPAAASSAAPARRPAALSPAQRADRDRSIAQAIAEGRLPEERRATYEEAWGSDPAGTRHLLTARPEHGGLAPAGRGAPSGSLQRALRVAGRSASEAPTPPAATTSLERARRALALRETGRAA